MTRKNSKSSSRLTKIKADEVFSAGPFRIERYGRFFRFSNSLTPKEHAALLDEMKRTNEEIVVKLENEIRILQNLITRYSPLHLLERAAYKIAWIGIKRRSESEFEGDEPKSLAALEYIQYLIARSSPNTDRKIPNEEEWTALWEALLNVLNLTQDYLQTRCPDKVPASEIYELRLMLDFRRLGVRVKRYPCFLMRHFEASLEPYDQQLQSTYEIGAKKLIEELSKIHRYQQKGLITEYLEVRNLQEEIEIKLLEAGCQPIGKISSPEELKRIKDILNTETFREIKERLEVKLSRTFSPTVFDITDITDLPKPLLELFSVTPGEAILESLTGPNHDDLSPLSTSILHYKPFLKVEGRWHYFYHSGFEDHLANIVRNDLYTKLPDQVSEMAKSRSNRLEKESVDTLNQILNPDFSKSNVYYPNPDDQGNLTEIDAIIGVDDVLFLVEAKAGGFSAAASRGAPMSMEQEFSDLIIEGQRQSERAERYLKSKDEVSLFDSSGQVEVLRIRHRNFRKVFRIVITQEDLGWVGAKIASLSILDPELSKSYPWHISIDDLRVVADLFQENEIIFAHYLEVRLMASAEVLLRQNDEIEHVSLYHKINFYHHLPFAGTNRMIYDHSYVRNIDHYFMEKSAGESPSIPAQKIPEKIRILVEALKRCRLPRRFEAGSIILSMDASSRDLVEGGLKHLDIGISEGRQRSFRMPFTLQQKGLSITRVDENGWNQELHASAVQMEVGGCIQWMVIQLAATESYKVTRIALIEKGDFSEEKLSIARLRHETKTKNRIIEEKTRRNDQCPCGSGKKYKKCHGKR